MLELTPDGLLLKPRLIYDRINQPIKQDTNLNRPTFFAMFYLEI